MKKQLFHCLNCHSKKLLGNCHLNTDCVIFNTECVTLHVQYYCTKTAGAEGGHDLKKLWYCQGVSDNNEGSSSTNSNYSDGE